MRLSTVLFVSLCLVALTVVAASETEHPHRVKLKQQGPVPLHYRRPLIDNSASSSPDKTLALAKIAKIIAKEPIAARLRHHRNGHLDLYNGEPLSAESAAARKSRVISKEVKSLQALVAQGRAILKVLPAKEKRLKKLKKQLKKLNSRKIKKAAAEKLAAQKQLLSDIAKQEKAMKKRLATLRATQNKLKTSVKKVSKIAKKAKKHGKKHAKKHAKKHGKKHHKKHGKKHHKKGKHGKKHHKKGKHGKKHKKHHKKALKKFVFRQLRSDVDVDSEAEADTEAQLEAEFGEEF